MIIALAADHGGFALKEEIKKHLTEREDVEILDLGAYSDDSADYPAYGEACGLAITEGRADCGIVFCGTGIGISIAANKVKGVRCAVCTNAFMAEMTKRHNDANILALGGRILDPELAKTITDIWLNTPFEGGRHQRRVDLLDQMGC